MDVQDIKAHWYGKCIFKVIENVRRSSIWNALVFKTELLNYILELHVGASLQPSVHVRCTCIRRLKIEPSTWWGQATLSISLPRNCYVHLNHMFFFLCAKGLKTLNILSWVKYSHRIHSGTHLRWNIRSFRPSRAPYLLTR